jgi:hypothetical protein
VVTGLDGRGRSTAAADGAPPCTWDVAEGLTVAELWQTAAPLAHPAQGTDLIGGSFAWPPAGGGVAWRHVTLAPGTQLGLDGDRLDLVLVRRGAVAVRAGTDGELEVDATAAVVRRGGPLALHNRSRELCELSVVSDARHQAGRR